MLLRARKIRWRLRRQHLSLSYTPSIKQLIVLYQVDESDDFLPSLELKAGAFNWEIGVRNVSVRFKEHNSWRLRFEGSVQRVTSRAWGRMKGYSLIADADFLNHDGTSEPIVLSDDDKHFSEVLIRYGKFSNTTLLVDFGFTLSYNIHDQVQIQGKTPHHDVLHEMKWELLKRYHRPISSDVNDFESSMDSFTIKLVVMHCIYFISFFLFPLFLFLCLHDGLYHPNLVVLYEVTKYSVSFVPFPVLFNLCVWPRDDLISCDETLLPITIIVCDIGKLGLVVEKGKEFQSLGAFAHVLCCTSPQELSDLAKEASEHDGRLAQRPLTKSGREIKAHQMLSN